MLIMHIGHISRTQSFQQNRHISFHALVALKLLVSLISRLVACSARIVVDRQTHRQTTVTLAAHARRGLIKYSLPHIDLLYIHIPATSLLEGEHTSNPSSTGATTGSTDHRDRGISSGTCRVTYTESIYVTASFASGDLQDIDTTILLGWVRVSWMDLRYAARFGTSHTF